jgi:acyl-CoA thioester hydrolase
MQDFKFPVSLNIRLDWSEQDVFGHINNVMYFKYLQASRVHYWDKLGLGQLGTTPVLGPLLAATHCDFRQPLYYPGNVEIRASIEFVKNTSFGIYHQIRTEKGALAAEGHDVIVLFNFQLGHKMPIPDDIRKKIEEMEERTFDNT